METNPSPRNVSTWVVVEVIPLAALPGKVGLVPLKVKGPVKVNDVAVKVNAVRVKEVPSILALTAGSLNASSSSPARHITALALMSLRFKNIGSTHQWYISCFRNSSGIAPESFRDAPALGSVLSPLSFQDRCQASGVQEGCISLCPAQAPAGHYTN